MGEQINTLGDFFSCVQCMTGQWSHQMCSEMQEKVCYAFVLNALSSSERQILPSLSFKKSHSYFETVHSRVCNTVQDFTTLLRKQVLAAVSLVEKDELLLNCCCGGNSAVLNYLRLVWHSKTTLL